LQYSYYYEILSSKISGKMYNNQSTIKCIDLYKAWRDMFNMISRSMSMCAHRQ